METINVHRIGSKCFIGRGDRIEARVIGIAIGENVTVTYEVAWWAGRERKTAWLQRNEIEFETVNTLRIGFSGGVD